MSSIIPSLPHELLLHIAQSVEDLKTFVAFRRSCKTFHAISDSIPIDRLWCQLWSSFAFVQNAAITRRFSADLENACKDVFPLIWRTVTQEYEWTHTLANRFPIDYYETAVLGSTYNNIRTRVSMDLLHGVYEDFRCYFSILSAFWRDPCYERAILYKLVYYCDNGCSFLINNVLTQADEHWKKTDAYMKYSEMRDNLLQEAEIITKAELYKLCSDFVPRRS